MSIQERIDLVGNVSAQARTWARDINSVSSAVRQLNRQQGGGGGATNAARSSSQKADLKKSRDYYKAEERAKADFTKNMAKHDRDANAAAKKVQAEHKARQPKQNQPANDNAQSGGLSSMMSTAAGNLMASAAEAAISKLAGFLTSMAGTFVAAQLFREQTLAGLTILQKSGSEAKKTWDESFKLARDTGSTQQETMTAIQGMMASGFKKNDAVEMYKLMTAMSVVNPAANLEGIARAISQIKNTGHLQGDELMQLADAGVNIDEVYNQLGKRLGKTRDQIMKMQSAGEIKSSDAIEAIKAAMKSSVGGNPEAVLKKRANSMTAILARLQAAPFTFFSGIEANPALADKMKDSLRGLVDMLDPSTEKGARFADAMSRLLTVISGPGLDAFQKIVDKTGDAADAFSRAAVEAEGLSQKMDGFKKKTGIDIPKVSGFDGQGLLDSILGPLYSIPRKISEILGEAGIEASGAEVAYALAFGIFGAMDSPLEAASAMVASMYTSIISTASEWATAGYNMAAGLAEGIASGASAAISAAVDMASSALAAAKSMLGIASPSKAFKNEVGAFAGPGLAKGMTSNLGVVERAGAVMGDTAVTATQKNMAGVASSSRAMNGTGRSPTQQALPFVGTAMRDLGVSGGQQTNNYLGGMRINAPIQSMSGNSTPQDIQSHIQQMIQQGVQGFMNKSAA